MKIRLPILIFFCSLLLALSASAENNDELCNLTQDAIGQASKIRGLTVKRKVPCRLENKEQVRGFVLNTLETKLPPMKLEMEEILYRSVGIISEEFEYKEGIVQLYTDQLGGYYDPDRDLYVMAAWIPAVMQTSVAVHELTHALQDQYYDLGKLIDNKLDNSDRLLASSALVEGDATAVMVDYSRALMGQTGIQDTDDVAGVMMQNVLGVGLLSGMSHVPMALKLTMVFPYTSGLNFVHTLLRRGGYRKIDQAFQRVPQSTEEILHPEKYLQGTPDFQDIADPAIPGSNRKVIYRDVIGEFQISALLSNFIADKNACALAAAGWGGDKAVIFEPDEKNGHTVLWETRWDSERDASEFFKLALQMMEARASSLTAVRKDDHSAESVLQKGRGTQLKKQGNTVIWLWNEKA